METVASIFESTKGAKALVEALATRIVSGKTALKQLITYYESASPSQRARCLEALELVTRKLPNLAASFLDIVVQAINDKNPALKRESSRVVANTAAAYPDWSAKVVPGLLKNTDDEGTVVRWSAALALSEIAKANPIARKKLMVLVTANAESEENNAIRNIYAKAAKAIEKQEKKK